MVISPSVAFITLVKRQPAQQRMGKLMQLGLQTNPDVEERLTHYAGTLGESPK